MRTPTALLRFNVLLKHKYQRPYYSSTLLRQTSTLGRVPIQKGMKIELTDVEHRICELVDGCATNLKEEKGIETSCRIAGGWVRDKLLGLDSNDIDIALTNMMGLDFAEHLAEFARAKGVTTGTISKIAQNPEQSKHLETATFRFLGLDIDLVNLRSEEYAQNSRIPSGVSFGTPLQDALRRDITINALFYNVHTRDVEDHTGKGLEDLRSGIIRTPLSPRETFLDDPLRVLRCIRFASRFGFKIVPEIKEAASDPVIQTALITKVARERIGEELSKMLKGRDPYAAIQLIREFSLYDSIFINIPPEILATFSHSPSPSHTAFAAVAILHNFLYQHADSELRRIHPTLLRSVVSDGSTMARMYLASSLTPYLGVTYQEKKKRPLAVEYIIRESLKLGTQNHFLDGIPALFASANLIRNPVLTKERFTRSSQRVALGLLLREKAVHNAHTGSNWTTSILFSLIQELVPLYDAHENQLDVNEASKILDIYNIFTERVEELGLHETLDAKPLLDGREVVQALDAVKPGPWMSKVMALVLEWHLDNPGGTKETCVAWLKDQNREGKLQIYNEVEEPSNKRLRTR